MQSIKRCFLKSLVNSLAKTTQRQKQVEIDWAMCILLTYIDFIYFRQIVKRMSTTDVIDKGRKLTSRIVWMDLEMTGLDVQKDRILEISCLITDKDLNIIAESPTLVIQQPEQVLLSMDEWCIEHHGDSGLTEASRNSTLSTEKAEDLLLEFLKKNVPEKSCPLAGNSIYMDRMFLNSHMPRVNDYIHYRIIDVSSIKELCRRWNPRVFSKQPKKLLAHRSLDDIKDTLEELKFYREHLFKI